MLIDFREMSDNALVTIISVGILYFPKFLYKNTSHLPIFINLPFSYCYQPYQFQPPPLFLGGLIAFHSLLPL